MNPQNPQEDTSPSVDPAVEPNSVPTPVPEPETPQPDATLSQPQPQPLQASETQIEPTQSVQPETSSEPIQPAQPGTPREPQFAQTEPVERPSPQAEPTTPEPVSQPADYNPFASPQPDAAASPQPQSTPAAQPATDPGKTLGVVSLVTSIIGLGLVGIIVGFIARHKSKLAGFKNGLALAGIIIGFINVILVSAVLIFFGSFFYGVISECNELGPGVHQKGATTITCGSPGDEGFQDTTNNAGSSTFDSSENELFLQSETIEAAPGVEVTTE